MRKYSYVLLIGCMLALLGACDDFYHADMNMINQGPPLNPDTELSSLELGDGTLPINFSPEVTSYSLEVSNDVASLTVTPTALTADCGKIEVSIGNGGWQQVVSGSASANLDLVVGANTVRVRVTARDPLYMLTYTITVTRKAVPGTDATLSGLEIAGVSLSTPFNPLLDAYEAAVAYDIATITVIATASDALYDKIEVQVNGGSWNEVLSGASLANLAMNVGINTVSVRVTAEDTTTTKSYTITVTRGDRSADATLSSLAVTGYPLNSAFAPGTEAYSVTIPYTVTSITVTAAANDASHSRMELQVNAGAWSTIVSGAPQADLAMSVGPNTVSVRVTAENTTTTKTYTITVTKSAGSANADLQSLDISGLTLNLTFDPNINTYSTTVPYTFTSITVTPLAADPLYDDMQVMYNNGSWVGIVSGASKTYTLSVGDNTVVVRVVAEDAMTVKAYTVTVTRTAASTNADLSNLQISAGSLEPAFSSANLYYEAQVPAAITTLGITPTASGINSTIHVLVNGTGTWQNINSGEPLTGLTLNTGINELLVRVTAEDQVTQKFYSIALTRNVPGLPDRTFVRSRGADGEVFAVARQSDGKILIGGSFKTYDGVKRSGIARLNADGTPDLSFNPGGAGAVGTHPENGTVRVIILLAGGKILIGGSFTSYNGRGLCGLARLNSDGSDDTLFNSGGSGFNAGTGDGVVNCIVVHPDGRLYVGGSFAYYNGVTPTPNIACLNYDGGVVSTDEFNPGSGPNDVVYAIAVQPSNTKLLVGGKFYQYGALTQAGIIRINPNGAVDTSFNPAGFGTSGVTPYVACITFQTISGTETILIGGRFTKYNNLDITNIARLTSEGTPFDSFVFNPGTSANDDIYTLTVDASNRILVGGIFTTYNTQTRGGLACLNNDGSLMNDFSSGLNPPASVKYWIRSIVDLPNPGGVLVGGYFDKIADKMRFMIAQMDDYGTLDTAFLPEKGPNGNVFSIVTQTVGSEIMFLVGGDFTSYNGEAHAGIVRLTSTGNLDQNFNFGGAGIGVDNCQIRTIVISQNGGIYIAGWFTKYNTIDITNIARLNPDGTLDTGFDPDISTNGPIYTLAVYTVSGTEEYVFAGGGFSSPIQNIAKFSINGAVAPEFYPSPSVTGKVWAIALDTTNQKLYIGGEFTRTVASVERKYIDSIDFTGTYSTSFNPGIGFDGHVNAIRMMPGGTTLLIGGKFANYQTTQRGHIALIDNLGNLQTPNFDGGTDGDTTKGVYCFTTQMNGMVLIGGDFTTFAGTGRNRVARINADWSLDTTFDPGLGANQPVIAVSVHPDTLQILIGGYFGSYNGSVSSRLASIHP